MLAAYYFEPTVGSTQDVAFERYAGEPLLVRADHQTSGRGRGGNPWWEAGRGLYASLAWEPSWPPADRARLSLVAGLAARATLPGRVGLKWPNDLVDGGARKVGGLLLEARGDVVVAGLGVNLWWPSPPAGAAALHETDPGPDEPARLAEAWADELLARAARGPASWGRDEYRQACVTLGRRITWEGDPPPGTGTAADVDTDGALLVDAETGRVRLTSATNVRSL